MNAHDRRRGTTLIELIVYIGVLFVVLNVAWLASYTCETHTRAVLRNAEDITRVLHTGERWREDIRSASAPPTLVEGTLHVPSDKAEILYRFASNTVLRKAGGGAWLPYLTKVKASRMQLDTGKHVASWRWEVELKSRRKARIRPLFTFRAVAAQAATR